MNLTGRQRRIVAAVADLTTRYGYPPTYREIAKAVGTTSTETVSRNVWTLQRAGVLRAVPHLYRSVRLAPDVVTSRDHKIARVVWAEPQEAPWAS